MPAHLELPGCRHDILGHYLKAIGLLRVLAKCADEEHRDSDAEGWWDNNKACFCLRSNKYDTPEKLTEFFETHYCPTPVFIEQQPPNALPQRRATSLAQAAYLRQAATNLGADIEQDAKASKALSAYRDSPFSNLADVLDTISAPRFAHGADNPLFLSKGMTSGTGHIWRSFAEYSDKFDNQRRGILETAKSIADLGNTEPKLQKLKNALRTAKDEQSAYNGNAPKKCASLKAKVEKAENKLSEYQQGKENERRDLEEKSRTQQAAIVSCLFTTKSSAVETGKGTPFFPDAIKTYNVGGGWVEETFPFAALDYILAVEGAFAMRGSVSRTLGANTRRFAAFPFVFDSGEDLVDDANKVRGTASSLWVPLWERSATYEELASFICDAQARLPRKEARFSAEFLRALHSQGVDAGFFGWQEFRFRMKGSRVPWVTAGNFSEAKYSASATLLNRALEPFDSTRFIEQFEIIREGGAASAKSPHRIRASLNATVENAFVATTAENSLEILRAAFDACKKLAISKSFRENSRLQRPAFFAPLPMPEWCELLRDLEGVPEFEIARAVASIVGQQKQRNGEYSKVQPLLGSLLPLKLGKNGWYLPTDNDRSNQAVWSGTDLCRDLAAILQRRSMDSAKEDCPALQAVFPARLESVLAFLNGELDDCKIARWIEALSLIGWHFTKNTDGVDEAPRGHPTPSAIPLPYAALRSLLDAELAYQKPETYKRRRSGQPVAQLCACSPHTLEQATREALRWLSIWGVPNPWGEKSCAELREMKGAYVVRLDECPLQLPEDLLPSVRVAAAVAIPLAWRDRWQLHRLVTLPINP
ncbi:MAG: type I-U CRISPR-associated protein Csx17 [Verrucomicrobiales bacterium]|nr:type I-U CRISPR-associated protein Csx17 [Verrucomicrobiales bacterium]